MTTLFLSLILGGLLMMRSLTKEVLVPEDGIVAATALPLDVETSKIGFETATFGLG